MAATPPLKLWNFEILPVITKYVDSLCIMPFMDMKPVQGCLDQDYFVSNNTVI